jgi:peptidoglycan/LPS O-acetylase OafA/YrhL
MTERGSGVADPATGVVRTVGEGRPASQTETREPTAQPDRSRQQPRSTARIAGLDGIRGIAALLVVLHHTYLLAFPGYPRSTGPAWLGWLIYGHFAVAVFIVLSGFSLAVAPVRAGWRIERTGRFFFRRAWRILPTYWPALALSLAIAWWVTAQPGEATPGAKSVVVNGLLLQDIVGAPTPNGAFWSIAVEVQLYFVFPLLIIICHRFAPRFMLAAVLATVVAVGALAPHVSAVGELMRLTPQFAALFAMGIAAAGIVRRVADRRLPLGLWAMVAALPVLALIAIRGSVWTIHNLFWVDLALGPAVALFIAAVAAARPARLARALDSRATRGLGSFSYSLYLTHAPIVVAWYVLVVERAFGHGLAAFVIALVTGVPLALVVARVFAAIFELPFTRHKSWPALRAAMRSRMSWMLRRPAATSVVIGSADAG